MMKRKDSISQDRKKEEPGVGRWKWGLLALLLLLFFGPLCGNASEQVTPPGTVIAAPVDQAQAQTLKEKWGIEVLFVRLTANGTMLDFRYRVVDPGKAMPVLDKHLKASLVDEKSGTELGVTAAPKIGSMRQRTPKPEANRTYFILFANRGGVVKEGGKVSVVIGDFKAEHIAVQ
jgi:hypothetical protein